MCGSSLTGVLIIKRDLDTRERQCEDIGRTPVPRGGSPEKPNLPLPTLIVDFQPPTLGGNSLPLFNPQAALLCYSSPSKLRDGVGWGGGQIKILSFCKCNLNYTYQLWAVRYGWSADSEATVESHSLMPAGLNAGVWLTKGLRNTHSWAGEAEGWSHLGRRRGRSCVRSSAEESPSRAGAGLSRRKRLKQQDLIAGLEDWTCHEPWSPSGTRKPSPSRFRWEAAPPTPASSASRAQNREARRGFWPSQTGRQTTVCCSKPGICGSVFHSHGTRTQRVVSNSWHMRTRAHHFGKISIWT